jgi:hypothetical protein
LEENFVFFFESVCCHSEFVALDLQRLY